METTSTTFTKVYNYLYNFNELSNNDITLLSFIISHCDNKQEFFYTDEHIVKHFNEKLGGVRMISRIIKYLKDNDFIITSTSKQKYPDSKWGNRRYITLGNKLDKNVSSTNKEVKIDQIKEDNIKVVSIHKKDIIVQQEEENLPIIKSKDNINNELVIEIEEMLKDNPWASVDDYYMKLTRYIGKYKLCQYELENEIKTWKKSDKSIIELISNVESKIDKKNTIKSDDDDILTDSIWGRVLNNKSNYVN
jgi:hypothetical protein